MEMAAFLVHKTLRQENAQTLLSQGVVSTVMENMKH